MYHYLLTTAYVLNHRWSFLMYSSSLPGRPTIWITVGQGPTALAIGAGGGCLDIFTLFYPFFPLSPSLWETARYRLKYCLKGQLNPKPTNLSSWCFKKAIICKCGSSRRYSFVFGLGLACQAKGQCCHTNQPILMVF